MDGVSVVGKRGPLPGISAREDGKPPVRSPRESERARWVPLVDPTLIRAKLGSGRSRRPGKVLFLLGEDIRPVENKFLPCG